MVKDQAPNQGQSSSAGFDASGEKSASIWEMVQAVCRTALLPGKISVLRELRWMLPAGQSWGGGGVSVALPFAAFNPKIYPETLLMSKRTELSQRAECCGDVVAVFLQDVKRR